MPIKILRPILFAFLLALTSPLLAQDVHQHRGGPAAASSTAALEQRISELEKRLDLMQALVQRKTR